MKAPGADAAALRLALRRAEVASRLRPRDAVTLDTVAMVQYRAGQYQDALDTVTRAAALRTRKDGLDEVISVLARLRLGQVAAARDRALSDRGISVERDLTALIEEAQTLSGSLPGK